MSNNKFESLLELLINEENDKAEALFHEIVVEKSRDIYENLADEEVTAEAMHDKKMKKEDEGTETESSEEDKVEETVATTLSNGLTTIFVDNPKLLDYLKSKIQEG